MFDFRQFKIIDDNNYVRIARRNCVTSVNATARIVAVTVAGWDVDPEPTTRPAGTRLTEASVKTANGRQFMSGYMLELRASQKHVTVFYFY